jgi:hypothetical protein
MTNDSASSNTDISNIQQMPTIAQFVEVFCELEDFDQRLSRLESVLIRHCIDSDCYRLVLHQKLSELQRRANLIKKLIEETQETFNV